MLEKLTKLKATVDPSHNKLGFMHSVDEDVHHSLWGSVENLYQILDPSKEPSSGGRDQHASIA